MTTDLVSYAEVACAAASNDRPGLARALESIDAKIDDVVATLLRLRIGQLVLATLSSADGDPHPVACGLHDAFERSGALPFTEPIELLTAFAEIRDLLARNGLPVLLLKGVVLADLLYGGIDHRPQHDVDLLVRSRDAHRAGRLIVALGYERRRRDSHALTLQRGNVQVDLHRRLRSLPAYAINETAAWQGARDLTIAGVPLRTTSDETTLTLVVTSLVEDIAFGMAKMKSACDVWLLVRHLDDTTDWGAWFAHRADERLDVIALNGVVLALMALDRTCDTPNFMCAANEREQQLRVRDRAHALDLVSATKGSAANMAWMGQIYPGSLIGFRIHPFVSGLPGTLRSIRSDWLRHQVRLRRSRRALRSAR